MSEKVWRNVPPEVIIRDIIESYDLPSAKEAMQNAAENFKRLPSAHDLLRRESVSETPKQPEQTYKRVIKFRAWDKESHEMIELANPRIYYGNGNKLVFGDNFHDDEIDGVTKNYVLMQYTGLQDSQGREIYEGDIVEFSIFPEPEQETKRIRDAIAFRGGCFVLSKRLDLLGGMPPHRGIEVIGNVHENPDLLEKKA